MFAHLPIFLYLKRSVYSIHTYYLKVLMLSVCSSYEQGDKCKIAKTIYGIGIIHYWEEAENDSAF
ncbi:hypothetical protein AXI59_16945 [Bacillus nakamurai]|nr:hypothetical protein AXI59_16945 [Bacillus nakamurai]